MIGGWALRCRLGGASVVVGGGELIAVGMVCGPGRVGSEEDVGERKG